MARGNKMRGKKEKLTTNALRRINHEEKRNPIILTYLEYLEDVQKSETWYISGLGPEISQDIFFKDFMDETSNHLA